MSVFRYIRSGLDAASSIAVIVVAIVIMKVQLFPAPVTAATPEKVDDVRLQTSQLTKRIGDSKLILVEFGDFECPYCAQHATNTFPRIRQELVERGHVSYAYVNFPLEQIHPHALQASQAAECARQQNKFWEMHDRLFANRSHLEHDDLVRYAEGIGIDRNAFAKCLATPTDAVTADKQIGELAGVQSTPSFYFGTVTTDGTIQLTRRISGAVPFGTFEAILDAMSPSPRSWFHRWFRS